MVSLKKAFLGLSVLLLCVMAQGQDIGYIEFIENKGQWDPHIKFAGDIDAGQVFITETGFTVVQHDKAGYATLNRIRSGHGKAVETDSVVLKSHAFSVNFVNALPNMQMLPEKPVEGYNNYFIGNDPAKWASGCKLYRAVTVKNVYADVDVRFYTDKGYLKYDIIAGPAADISKIALEYDGVDYLKVKNKQLVIGTSMGEFTEAYPYSYFVKGDGNEEVKSGYLVNGKRVTFDIKRVKNNSTLVIDPSLIFCSLSRSNADNWGFTATYGPDGSFFGGGIVFASGFPVSTGAFQTTYRGGSGQENFDMGIIKLSANGSNRLYATYIGGNGADQPHSLITDAVGNLIIAGRSQSANYPVIGANIGAGGGYDIVVTKLNANGTALIGSKKIGGSGDDGVNISTTRTESSLNRNYGDDGRSEVILDGAGNIYVASCTRSTNFPTTPQAFQGSSGGRQDGVVLKMDPNAGTLLFSSYLGGSEDDAAYVLSLAPNGEIYVGGGTASGNFPGTKAAAGPSLNGGIDGFVARVSNDGANLNGSIFVGTSGVDQVYGLKFDRNGFPYVTGQSTGSFPVLNASYSNPGAKQFIGKLQPNLSAWVYSTVFGRSATYPNISITAFLVDRCENVYVSGWGGGMRGYNLSGTNPMPLTADALQTRTDGDDFYFFVLQRDAQSQLYGSYFGQVGGETPDHVDGGTSRFDPNGIIYQAVCANCQDPASNGRFPTTPGAWGTIKPRTAFCNLGMIKIAFNLAGVGASIQSEIDGVPLDTAGCVPLTVQFTDRVRNAQEYIWNFGDDGNGPVDPLANPQLNERYPALTGVNRSHTFNNIGTYRVMLIAIDPASCNQRDTSFINIRVSDNRADLAAGVVKLPPCTQYNYQFTNSSISANPSISFTNTSFIWDFGDGSPRQVAGLGSVNHTYAAPGTYIARLILTDNQFCNYPDSLELTVRVATNVRADFVSPPVACIPYNAVFENTSAGGLNFIWDFYSVDGSGNLAHLQNSTQINGSYNFTATGDYRVRLIAIDSNTCNIIDTVWKNITLHDGPVAALSYTPVTPQPNVAHVFTNGSSANSVRFVWDFNDGDTLATTSFANVTHQYNATGTYYPCLIAYSAEGCADTACTTLEAIVNPKLDVPNAFTPGRGGINSVIKVAGYGIAKMRFTIYNRQGLVVFVTENRSEGWDGKYKGVLQPMDVYAYTLDAEFFDGEKVRKTGDITLIR